MSPCREHASVLVHAPHGGVVWEVGQGMQWREVPAANPTSGTGSLVPYTEAFAYDHAGNLLTTSHTGDVNWIRTQGYAATSNRLASSQVGSAAAFNATHDAFGNMLAMPGLDEMQWDVFGNLHATVPYSAGSQRTFYTYDATGNRVRKVTETSVLSTWIRSADTLYLGGFELVRTWTGTDGETLDDEIETLHVMDADARLAIVETQTVEAAAPPTTIAPKWRYNLDDLIGSSAVELGRDGQVISYEEFHPYGTTALLIDTGGEGFRKRYRWSGKERDAESGLVYFGARYFAPWLGRWASADPAGAVDGNPYRVVRGNPVALREVDGRQGASPYDLQDYPDATSSTTAEEAAALRSETAGGGTPPEVFAMGLSGASMTDMSVFDALTNPDYIGNVHEWEGSVYDWESGTYFARVGESSYVAIQRIEISALTQRSDDHFQIWRDDATGLLFPVNQYGDVSYDMRSAPGIAEDYWGREASQAGSRMASDLSLALVGSLAIGATAPRGAVRTRDLVRGPPTTASELISRLSGRGVRHTGGEIVAMRMTDDGIVFLEQGNARSGLTHIVERHGEEFAARGISEAQIPSAIMEALSNGTRVGTQGRTRAVYELTFNGQIHRIAIEVGDNGYVVSANPARLR